MSEVLAYLNSDWPAINALMNTPPPAMAGGPGGDSGYSGDSGSSDSGYSGDSGSSETGSGGVDKNGRPCGTTGAYC